MPNMLLVYPCTYLSGVHDIEISDDNLNAANIKCSISSVRYIKEPASPVYQKYIYKGSGTNNSSLLSSYLVKSIWKYLIYCIGSKRITSF